MLSEASLETKLRGLDDLELSKTERLSLIDECQEFVHRLGSDLTSPSPEVRIRNPAQMRRESGRVQGGSRSRDPT